MGIIDRLLGRANGHLDGIDGLQSDELEMIRGVVKLSELTAKDVLVPRIDTVFVSEDSDADELMEILNEHGHSRVPVYEGTIDNVVGVLYVKDLLPHLSEPKKVAIASLARKPYLIPESKRLNSLLREFQRRRVHLAVVVDEYGGVSGIVALEDIIEEIVGDIQDEYDNELEDIIEIGDGVYLCEARVALEELSELIGTSIPVDDFETLGGFVFDLFGKIPVKFEKATHEGMDFVVQDIDGNRIKSVKIVTKGKNVKSEGEEK